MHVSILPDPLLFEHPGGMQAQVRETMAALARLGAKVTLASGTAALPAGCDVLHVFGAGRGHGRVVEEAAAAGVPVVLSPRLSPAWNSSNGTRARVADRVFGNRTSWDFDTGYAQIRRALGAAELVLALGEPERKAICTAFLVAPQRVKVVPNGIARRFFEAEPAAFRARHRIAGPFALVVGQVSGSGNQLGIARALAGIALPLVVIGDVRERDTAYMRELRAARTVLCLGPVEHDDPLLASAYAAASVFIVPGDGTPLPGSALDALAAGTPVVASCGLPNEASYGALRVVPSQDPAALAQAVSDLLADPPERANARRAVAAYTWDGVARQLLDCYQELAPLRTP